MKQAKYKDKERVIQIIEESFNDNYTFNWIIKNDHKKAKRIKALAEYMWNIGMAKKGIYLSPDNEAVAICYKKHNRVNIFKNIYYKFKFLKNVIGFSKIFSILKRQKRLMQQKPSSNYLYFWLFAASNKGKGGGGAKNLQKGIYKLSYKENLPIYLETSIRKNKNVYERYGFQTYHKEILKGQPFDTWFMKKNPTNNNTKIKQINKQTIYNQ